MDTQSLLIGILIGAAGAFGSGVFRKAGEDVYAAIMKRAFPKSTQTSPPQVVINFQGKEVAEPSQLAPIKVEHLSQLSFSDIEKAIESAPPLQQKTVANSYIGIKVEWITYLRSASKWDSGDVSLRLSIDEEYRGRSVLCKVPDGEYRELKILPKGARIRVSGEISEANTYDIELKNVRLLIL